MIKNIRTNGSWSETASINFGRRLWHPPSKFQKWLYFSAQPRDTVRGHADGSCAPHCSSDTKGAQKCAFCANSACTQHRSWGWSGNGCALMSWSPLPAEGVPLSAKRSLLAGQRQSHVKEIGKGKKGKAIPVAGRGGPQGSERPRLSHFLDNRLTDGGEVVSLTRHPHFIPQEDSWYSFLLEAESTPGP
jgi:hypothetical protein